MDSIRDDALDTRRVHKGGAAVLSLLLTVALTMFAAVFTAPAHADTRTLDNVVAYQGAVPSSVATPLALANAALA